MRNEFIRNLVLGPLKIKKFFGLQKELFPLPFLEFPDYFNFVTFEHYYLFNILKFSSNRKLEKEKLNKKSSLFKKVLELHLLLGFLSEACKKAQSPM